MIEGKRFRRLEEVPIFQLADAKAPPNQTFPRMQCLTCQRSMILVTVDLVNAFRVLLDSTGRRLRERDEERRRFRTECEICLFSN